MKFINILDVDPFVVGAIKHSRGSNDWTLDDMTRYVQAIVDSIRSPSKSKHAFADSSYFNKALVKKSHDSIAILGDDLSKCHLLMMLDILPTYLVRDLVVSCLSHKELCRHIVDLATTQPDHLDSLMDNEGFSSVALRLDTPT